MKTFILLFISAFQMLSSLNVDSLKDEIPNLNGEEKLDAILNITKYYDNKNYDSTTKYNQIYLNLAKKENNSKHLARAYANSAYYNVSLGFSYKALLQIDSATYYYFKINDSVRAAFTYNVKARIFENTGNTDSAFHYYSKALKLLKIDSLDTYIKNYEPENEKIKFRLNVFSIVMTDFGLFNVNLLKYDKAEELYQKTLEIAQLTDDDKRKAGTYSNLGMIFERRDSTDIALNYYQKALDYAEKSNATLYKMSILNNIGVIYSEAKYDTDSLDKALKYYQDAAQMAKEASDKKSELVFQLNYSRMLAKKGELKKAFSLIDTIYNNLKNIEDNELWSRYYRNLSLINSDNNNYEDAYSNVIKAQSYRDSFRNEKSLEQINRLQVAFDSERKDYQIELLTKEKELLNNRIIQIIGIIIFILILISLFYSRYRIKIKAYKKIEAMNEQLKKSEKELKELNATKDKFFSIIAHDLKGPIGTYKNVLEFIERDINRLSKDEIGEFILDLRESSDSLFALLNDLLSWARTQTGKLEFSPQKHNLKEIFNNNISILELSAGNKNISLVSALEKDLFVELDVTMITTVIRNMISNAIKFTDENGKIVLNAIEKDNEVIVSVKDNGIGMDEETKNKLFKISEHLTSRGTNNEKGTGLGLILCKEFVAKHNGKIWAESEKGKGSEFKFTIPKKSNKGN